jgi:hypothetical protein
MFTIGNVDVHRAGDAGDPAGAGAGDVGDAQVGRAAGSSWLTQGLH